MRKTVLGAATVAMLAFGAASGLALADGGNSTVSDAAMLGARMNLASSVILGHKWAPLAMDGAICLPNFAEAHLRPWLGPAEYNRMMDRIGPHAAQIVQLRRMLSECPDAAQADALKTIKVDAIWGLDVRRDGTTVLFVD